MARRKRAARGAASVFKRYDCRQQEACEHPWWLRVKVGTDRRQRINLSELFPDDSAEVAAARAKDWARKGLIKAGRLVAPPDADTRLTCRYVASKYVEARGDRKHYYLDGLLAIDVPAATGTSVKIGDKPMDEITTADIRAAVDIWRKRKRTLAGAKGGAVAERHLKQAARHLFNWSVAQGYSTRTPFRSAQGVPLISIKTTSARKRRLQEGEDARIREAASPFIGDFFDAMLETGCRPGELRTLQWSEVKDDHFVVLAAKAKDREERRIPIMPTLRTIFDRRRLGPDGTELPADAYVFGDETGAMIRKERLCKWWRLTCAKAHVTDLHLHDLRAEFASQLAEAKVPVEQVRDALGHANISMTNTYLRSRMHGLKSAYQRRSAHQARQKMRAVK